MKNKISLVLSVVMALFLFISCGEDGKNGNDGKDGADGLNGTGCAVTENGDSTYTITCGEGTTVTVSDGAKGEKGESGEDGTDGDDGVDGTDGINGVDGTNCTVIDNFDGTYTVTCGEVSVIVKDGEKGETGETGDAGANGHNSMIVIEKMEPGDEDCPNGGQLVTVGVDLDDSGTLDEGEGNVSQKVCNGLDGKDGVDGEDGVDGIDGTNGTDGEDGYNSLVEVTPDTDICPAGGYNIKTGIDTNGNFILDTDPNEVVSSVYVCNGVDGEDGADGKSATVSITTLLPGEEGCVAGGYKIEIGIEGGIPETVIVCNGEKGEKGDPGEDGVDGVCAGNNAPVIEKIEINGEEFTGSPIIVDLMPIPVVITATDADGDPLSVAVSGAAIVEDEGWDGDKNTSKLTLTKTGANTFSVIVSDGCQIVVKTFTVMSYELRSTKQWGTSDDDSGRSVAIDNIGNIFVTGYTKNSLDGNTNSGLYDIFLTKWNVDGTKAWTKQWGTSGRDYGYSVAVDSIGNIFVTGYTEGSLDGNSNAGLNDIFLTKWNADGTKAWTKQWGTNNYDYGHAVFVDSSGNIFVTGQTNGSLDGITYPNGSDVFLTKWNANGTKAWTKQWGADGVISGRSVAMDGSGNIFITGYVNGSFDGNPSFFGPDMFILKVSSDGSKLLTRQLGADHYVLGYSIAVDSEGNIFVTGYTTGSLDGNTNLGLEDIFLTKWNADGTKAWTKQWGTSGDDRGYSVAVDSRDNIFVTGYTEGSLDGNLNAGAYDIFLTKWSPNGTKVWTKQWGAVGYDEARSVMVDDIGNIYITGQAGGSLDGNTPAGFFDIFLTKWVF